MQPHPVDGMLYCTKVYKRIGGNVGKFPDLANLTSQRADFGIVRNLVMRQ